MYCMQRWSSTALFDSMQHILPLHARLLSSVSLRTVWSKCGHFSACCLKLWLQTSWTQWTQCQKSFRKIRDPNRLFDYCGYNAAAVWQHSFQIRQAVWYCSMKCDICLRLSLDPWATRWTVRLKSAAYAPILQHLDLQYLDLQYLGLQYLGLLPIPTYRLLTAEGQAVCWNRHVMLHVASQRVFA